MSRPYYNFLMQSIFISGDKSLSHRYLMFEYLYESSRKNGEEYQKCQIKNISPCADVKTTRAILKSITQGEKILDCGNSGTSIRLMTAILAAKDYQSKLIGDSSLSTRPMRRITEPLNTLGAKIHSSPGGYTPLEILKSQHNDVSKINLEISSAQVKSAILLFALCSEKKIKISGKIKSRDHTEIFLQNQGLNIQRDQSIITLNDSDSNLKRFKVNVAGDPSSAAFLIIAKVLKKSNTALKIENLLLNPLRVRYLELLKSMNVRISIKQTHTELGERVGEVTCFYTPIEEISMPSTISTFEISSLIDEFPILSLLFSQVKGSLKIESLQELKYKESNRLQSIIDLMTKLNPLSSFNERGGDLLIDSKGSGIREIDYQSHDHRMLMTYYVSQYIKGFTLSNITRNESTISISYPNFFNDLKQV